MIRLEDLDLERASRHLIVEDRLRIECTVVVTDAGMIAANDEMCRTHVLTEIGMQDRLTRAGIEHVEAVTGDHRAVRREVQFDHLANRRITHRRRDITRLELAEQHVNHQAVTAQTIHGHVTEFLVRQMHRVAGLEGHNLFPPTLGDFVADLDSGAESVGEIGDEVRKVQYLDWTRHADPALRVERSDARMLRVAGTVDLLGHHLHLLIGDFFNGLHLHNRQYRIALDIGVTQRNALGVPDRFRAFDQAHHRDREERAIAQGHLFRGAHRVSDIHETRQGAEITGAHHHGIAGRLRTDQQGRQALGVVAECVVLGRVVDEKGFESVGADGLDHA